MYQVARRAGHAVLPNYDKDTLIRIIIGEREPPPVRHDFDAWRAAIVTFLLEHRRMLETQVSCPAKCLYTPAYAGTPQQVVPVVTQNRDACFGCVDAQVVHCLTSQGDANFQLIELRKKTD